MTQLKEYLLNMNSKFYNEKTAWIFFSVDQNLAWL
jgi:hypothetical protein